MDTKKESAAKWVDIDKVRPWGRNPKRLDESDVARMVRSIERFGWADVIVAREADGEIISGHLRHAAAKSLGMAKVPVRYLPIDSAEAHALAVAVTQHEAVRTFDESIGALLADMQEEGIDLDGLGWSEDELRDIIAAGQVEELEPEDPDDVPEVATVVHSVKGEVYELGPHRLVCGDSTSTEAWSDLGLSGCIAILTDPPYGQSQPGVPGDSEAEHAPLMKAWVGACGLSDAAIVVFQSTKRFPPMLDAARDAGWRFECMLWLFKKAQMAYPWRGWIRKSEAILVFSIGEPDWHDARPYVHDTYEVASVQGELPEGIGWHGSVKPVAVVADIARRIVRPGGAIVDPFAGSGTTLMACAETGRVARLIELDPKYCDVIRRRWTRYAKKNGLDAGPGALEDADVEA